MRVALGVGSFVFGAVVMFALFAALPDRWNDELDLTVRWLTVGLMAVVLALVLRERRRRNQ